MASSRTSPVQPSARQRKGLRLLPLGLGVALGASALGFAAWPQSIGRGLMTATARSAVTALAEQSQKEEVIKGFGLATVEEQQLYDRRIKRETRLVRAQAKLPWWKRNFLRLVDDIGGMLTMPIRLVRLGKITKEVGVERVEYYKTIKAKRDQPEDGDGKPRQGLRGDIRGFKAGMKLFFATYMKSHAIARTSEDEYREMLNVTLTQFLDSVAAQEPYNFEPFHKAVRGPDFDYYSWGNRFFRPLIKYRSSRVEGIDNLKKIKGYLKKGENVILIANHQTEADPQVLSILLEMEGYEEIAESTIFVAGHKVTTDPLAVPFSLGRNLLTIFSKKYLDAFDEEEKEAKSARNRQTVTEMQRLFNEGGNIFWVAPSGGRDRRSEESKEFEPAKFDAQSVGLFSIMAKKAEKGGAKTHFFPLAMWTHRLVPPPEGTAAQVGEARSAARAAVGIAFGEEVDPEEAGGRKKFPGVIEKAVIDSYWAVHKTMRRRK